MVFFCGIHSKENYENVTKFFTSQKKAKNTNMENLSINKDEKSPYWMVTFRDSQGRQRRRSTKVPVKGGLYKGENLTAKQAEKRALIVGISIANQQAESDKKQNNISVRAFLDNYIRRAAARMKPQSIKNVYSARDHFCAWLGKRADYPLHEITRLDCKNFTEYRRELIRCSSTQREIGYLKTAFNDAYDSEIINRNPWIGIKIAPDSPEEKTIKEALTFEEVQYIIENFPPEWASAVRCSYETFGQRLGDIIKLRWRNFDWENRAVIFTAGKTDTPFAQPIRESFYNWAREQYEKSGCDDNALLHPLLASTSTSISYEFTQLLRAHNIGIRQKVQKGQRRNIHSKSFHSIRATSATYLHYNGVSENMAMKLVGHKSKAIHDIYVKPNADMLRDIAEKLPQL